MNAARPGARRERRRGIALVMVLWVGVILGLVAMGVGRIARTDLHLARNLEEAARAELAADGAVRRVLYTLMVAGRDAWRSDGAVYAWREGGIELRATLTDEFGRIDINRAPPRLLAALFRAAGGGDAAPERLAKAVDSYRTAEAAVLAEGEAGSGGSLRLTQPFLEVADLARVDGISLDLAGRLADALSVHSGRALPVIGAAPAIVREAMGARGAEERADGPAADGEPGPPALADAAGSPGPSAGRTATSGLYRIRAEALTDRGGHFAREAIVAIGRRNAEQPYAVRLWRASERRLFP